MEAALATKVAVSSTMARQMVAKMGLALRLDRVGLAVLQEEGLEVLAAALDTVHQVEGLGEEAVGIGATSSVKVPVGTMTETLNGLDISLQFLTRYLGPAFADVALQGVFIFVHALACKCRGWVVYRFLSSGFRLFLFA